MTAESEKSQQLDQPDAFVQPSNRDTSIWRYMSLATFVSLLDKQALFFCRADRLGDEFEGSISLPSHQQMEAFLRYTDNPNLREVGRSTQYVRKWCRQWTFVNCWHMNEDESDAMWKVYGRTDEGVAVQSTYAKLADCVRPQGAHIGVVQYIDYQTSPPNHTPMDLHAPLMQKRKPFEHEREVRAILQDFPTTADPSQEPPAVGGLTVMYGSKALCLNKHNPNPDGRYVRIDAPKLIHQVKVAPNSGRWFLEVVRSVVQKYGLNVEVTPSALAGEPVF